MGGVRAVRKAHGSEKAPQKPERKRKSAEKSDADGNAEPKRKSFREKKPVNYNEDSLVEAREAPKPGSYIAPHDPPGMKSTAYLCKTPSQPGPKAEVHDQKMPMPTRNKVGEWVFADYPNFRPNLSPAEVLKDGAFGGTYFRKIKSAVTGEEYENVHLECPAEWFKGIPAKHLTSKHYHASVNKWGVECGGALDMWESSGWISNIDPYGWFQWYCRFFLGRRSSDDERQISRMNGVAGPKGRFRNQLLNKIMFARTQYDDPTISPVIRQTLHHWAYQITAKDLAQHK